MVARSLSLVDLPHEVAVFPLPGALLLPRARLPLHIFEPRYLAMVEAALSHPMRLIGMISPIGQSETETRLARVGCAGRISQFTELDDGRMLITLQGVARFRLGAEVEGFTPYRRFGVDFSDFAADLGGVERDPDFDRPALWALLARYLAACEVEQDWSGLEEAPDEVLINALSMLTPLPPEDRQALLEAPNLRARRERLFTLIEFALRGGSSDEVLQ